MTMDIISVFSPPLRKNPIKTLDLPIGGEVYSSMALSLVSEFVNIVNGVKQDGNGKLLEDTSGEQTIDFLTKCRRIARRINSDHPSSLGLHPAVYFYSKNGNLQPASLYAITALMLEFERRNIYDEFIKVRDSFENVNICGSVSSPCFCISKSLN
jgi:hypothetical protein